MRKSATRSLWESSLLGAGLPFDYQPERPGHFEVQRIYLARGSVDTPERERFVQRICAVFPEAHVVERLGTPHNRIDLDEPDDLKRHALGKRTLVFGELKSAVRFSEEEGNTCPNYWHVSPYGYCFYGCKYCYLAGTRGVWFSPTVKIFVNLPEIIAEIDRTANRLGKPTAFYLGKLQDGLSLDPLTAYSTVLVPFFAGHRFARQVLLSKSAEVRRLLPLEHNGHTILSWSLNPPEIASRFEDDTPSVEDRLAAMQRCAAAGYPLRAVLMPLIPVDGWERLYPAFVERLLSEVPLRRLTLGGICSYKNAAKLMALKIGVPNEISSHMQPEEDIGDGRTRYAKELRIRMYSALIAAAREAKPDVELALCLEEPEVWEAVGLAGRIGRCNCVL